MIKCYKCENEIAKSDKGFFCPNCLTQIKCKNCGEALEKEAIGCVMCGTPLIKAFSEKKNLIKLNLNRKETLKNLKHSFLTMSGKI